MASAGHQKTAKHIFSGPANEQITPLQGCPETMEDMMQDAHNAGLKYGFHHFKISPDKEISREQAQEDFKAISKEYGFELNDCVIVEHRKKRATASNSPIHWHLIAPHLNPQTGKALNMRNNYKRNEKLSRLSEIRTGQKILTGKHNKAVFKQLLDEGKTAQAKAIQHTTSAPLPHASYGEETRRIAERQGLSLPDEKARISAIWKQCDGIKAFISALNENGFLLKKGIKKDTFIIERDGVLVGSASRLLKIKKQDFAKMFNDYKEQTNEIMAEQNENGRKKETDTNTKKADSAKTKNDHTTTRKPDIDEGESGHRTDFGFANRQTRKRPARPDSADFRPVEHDSGTEQRDYKKPVAHSKNVIASAKIRKRGDFKKREKFAIITPEYLQNIKDKLAKEKTGNRDFYREQYKNIKDQEYHIDTYNKSIDANVSLLLVDMFLRLFGYSIRKNKPTPIIKKPDVQPPVSREDFDLMTEQEKKTVTYKALGLYRSAYMTYSNLCKKHDVPHAGFQEWLNDLGNDYMSEQIANLFPELYMKELDKSANEYDKLTLIELRKIWNGETSKYESQFADIDGLKTHITHAHGEIREHIRIEDENKTLDKLIAQQAQEYHQQVSGHQTDQNQTPEQDASEGLRIR
ncbi:hypothetical protein AA15973_2739 [Komagataeibacter sucrofermentans DSM 15973]|nr:hypothetical protein AA15973_2739 [Komagataeibacter sucrofermentans DSM 15973]